MRLLDQVRRAIRLRHYTKRTEETYVYWIRYFIKCNGTRNPAYLGTSHVRDFLTYLALAREVTPNTQKVALNALTFLYTQVLDRKELDVSGFRPAMRDCKLPVVLTRQKLAVIFGRMNGDFRLCARLMYGSGLRVMEVLRLRVHDVDMDRLSVLVRDGKGRRRRITTLAESAMPEIRRQLGRAKWCFEEDQADPEWCGVELPYALARKCPQDHGRGAGSTCFRPGVRAQIRAPGSAADTTFTSALCSGRSPVR